MAKEKFEGNCPTCGQSDLRDENAMLRAALAKYANRHNWFDNGIPDDRHALFAPEGELRDGWEVAERALGVT